MPRMMRNNQIKRLIEKQEKERQLLMSNQHNLNMTVTVEQAFDTIFQLGKAIYSCRKFQGLTQQELADYAGVGRKFIIDLEKANKEGLEFGKVLKVCKTLGIELKVKYTHD